MVTIAGADASSLRAWNERALLAALRDGGEWRISDLATISELSAPTIRSALNSLADKGWVDELEPTPAPRGRPAASFRARKLDHLVAGIDAGAHSVRVCLVDPEQQVVGQVEHEVRRDAPDQERRALVDRSLDELAAGRPVWAAGIALGGTVRPDGLVSASIAMPHWEQTRPHRSLVPDRLPVVAASNDVRAALFAEVTAGSCSGRSDVLFIQLGRRPTFTLSADSQLLEGSQGWAGEVTASTLLPKLADSAWVARHQQADDPVGAALTAAASGNPTDCALALDFWREFIPVIDFASCLVDPEAVVVAGLNPVIRDTFMAELAAHVREHVPGQPSVHTSSLGRQASAVGAALAAAARIEDHLLPVSGLVLPHEQGEIRAIAL